MTACAKGRRIKIFAELKMKKSALSYTHTHIHNTHIYIHTLFNMINLNN